MSDHGKAAGTIGVDWIDERLNRRQIPSRRTGTGVTSRLALLHRVQLPEETAVFLETDDDLDFIDGDGGKSLQSRWPCPIEPAILPVHHRHSIGHSFLARLLPDQPAASGDPATPAELADAALATEKSQLIGPIATEFSMLSDSEKQDSRTHPDPLQQPSHRRYPGDHTGQAHA